MQPLTQPREGKSQLTATPLITTLHLLASPKCACLPVHTVVSVRDGFPPVSELGCARSPPRLFTSQSGPLERFRGDWGSRRGEMENVRSYAPQVRAVPSALGPHVPAGLQRSRWCARQLVSGLSNPPDRVPQPPLKPKADVCEAPGLQLVPPRGRGLGSAPPCLFRLKGELAGPGGRRLGQEEVLGRGPCTHRPFGRDSEHKNVRVACKCQEEWVQQGTSSSGWVGLSPAPLPCLADPCQNGCRAGMARSVDWANDFGSPRPALPQPRSVLELPASGDSTALPASALLCRLGQLARGGLAVGDPLSWKERDTVSPGADADSAYRFAFAAPRLRSARNLWTSGAPYSGSRWDTQ